MKYHFIEEHKHKFPIVVMCGVLAVSKSGFYAWRKRPTVSGNEKMLISSKKFGRYLKSIWEDTERYAFIASCMTKGSAAHGNACPG